MHAKRQSMSEEEIWYKLAEIEEESESDSDLTIDDVYDSDNDVSYNPDRHL